ncbi:hypothetical protein D9615_006663 [Tricholomella constricta]|uniref:Uncharacterized protein n=1 Tax=Tricholomella constricta TaxID=117010 RepID=A0A8H5HA29_9AGAR|nr:hypothetical protein D9615_006663 [Tricholomella constricta]
MHTANATNHPPDFTVLTFSNMPSHSHATIVAIMAPPGGMEPWNWPAWAERTGGVVPPFSDDAQPDEEFTQTQLDEIRAYVLAMQGKAPGERYAFASNRRRDNHQSGRAAWGRWVKDRWADQWGINQLVDRVLQENGATAYEIMRGRRVDKLPDIEDADLGDLHKEIASEIFGPDAFISQDTTRLPLKKNVKEFVQGALCSTWERYRGTVTRQRKKMKTDMAKEAALWKKMTKKDARPTAAQIRGWVRLSSSLMVLLKNFSDEQSVSELQKRKETIGAMLAAIGQGDQAVALKLPKALRDALERLATAGQIRALEVVLDEAIRLGAQDQDLDVPTLEDDDVEDEEWQEGVEAFKGYSIDDLWAALGLSRTRVLPFFNNFTDPMNLYTPWTPDGVEFFHDPASRLEVFAPRWHQLVGILKLVQLSFAGLPCLLMDEVGLGKTLQVIGTIAVLAYFRRHYAETRNFPGSFRGLLWQKKVGNIPNVASLLVVPVNLHAQMMSEAYRYLMPGSFDILPYLGTHQTHAHWWETIASMTNQPPGQRIVISTVTAVKSDSEHLFTVTKGKPSDLPRQLPHVGRSKQRSVYGQRWLVVAVDEAHVCRTVGPTYTACMALNTVSESMIAMTATPVTTRLQDLWNIGRVLRLGMFVGAEADDEAREIQRLCAAAKRQDRKAFKETHENEDAMRSILTGQDTGEINTRHKQVVIDKMKGIRYGFDGVVIRRTGNSLDDQGKPIIGLAPFREFVLTLDLYPHEMECLRDIANDLVKNSSVGLQFGMGKRVAHRGAGVHGNGPGPCPLHAPCRVSSVYIAGQACMRAHRGAGVHGNGLGPCPQHAPCQVSSVHIAGQACTVTVLDRVHSRHPLLHMTCNPRYKTQWPAILDHEKWREIVSRKLEVLVQITTHHLKQNFAPPLIVNEESQVVPGDYCPPVVEGSHPDKMVIYGAFPSSNTQIIDVLNLHGISDIVEVNGNMSTKSRQHALQRFDKPDGPRVLLMSAVGMTGLNLPIANILIMLDTLWSAQEDRQLIGRIWRTPQKKEVHVYRLIANGTPDVFLNHLSFDKSAMHEAFTGSEPSIQRLFGKHGPPDVDEDEQEQDSDADPIQESDSDDEGPEDGPETEAGQPSASSSTLPTASTAEATGSKEDKGKGKAVDQGEDGTKGTAANKGKGKAVDQGEDGTKGTAANKGKGKAVAQEAADEPQGPPKPIKSKMKGKPVAKQLPAASTTQDTPLATPARPVPKPRKKTKSAAIVIEEDEDEQDPVASTAPAAPTPVLAQPHKPPGDAVDEDGYLKEAADMTWHHDVEEETAINDLLGHRSESEERLAAQVGALFAETFPAPGSVSNQPPIGDDRESADAPIAEPQPFHNALEDIEMADVEMADVESAASVMGSSDLPHIPSPPWEAGAEHTHDNAGEQHFDNRRPERRASSPLTSPPGSPARPLSPEPQPAAISQKKAGKKRAHSEAARPLVFHSVQLKTGKARAETEAPVAGPSGVRRPQGTKRPASPSGDAPAKRAVRVQDPIISDGEPDDLTPESSASSAPMIKIKRKGLKAQRGTGRGIPPKRA